MDKLIAFSAVASVALIGLLHLFWKLKVFSDKRNFANSFLAKLQEYLESLGKDTDAYSWLLNRSNKMQSQMGNQGIYAHYKPPYENYMINNYAIIINMIPELRRALQDSLFSSIASDYSNSLQEAIIRHIGTIEDITNEIKVELKNPFIWLREGVRKIIATPTNLLAWFGLITDSFADKIITSVLFKIFSGSVATIGFVSAIVTITLGWKEFLIMVKSVLP